MLARPEAVRTPFEAQGAPTSGANSAIIQKEGVGCPGDFGSLCAATWSPQRRVCAFKQNCSDSFFGIPQLSSYYAGLKPGGYITVALTGGDCSRRPLGRRCRKFFCSASRPAQGARRKPGSPAHAGAACVGVVGRALGFFGRAAKPLDRDPAHNPFYVVQPADPEFPLYSPANRF